MEPYLQLGAVAILFLIAIKEFFSYLKSRKTSSTSTGLENVVEQIQILNSNHLNSIEKSINSGNESVVRAITDMHADLKEILGRIDGKLSR